MGLYDVHEHVLELEQQAAELAAEQAELQQTLHQGKLGPIDYQAVKADLARVRAELVAVRASLASAERQQKRLLASQAVAGLAKRRQST